jgi:hypothetical protein
MDTDRLLEVTGLFWQYPVITEKTFYEQNKGDADFLAFPWATIIDKRVDLNRVYLLLKQCYPEEREYYTCCQHIHYFKMIKLWKALGIKKAYVSHKQIGIDEMLGITLLPCPLYAVNIEDDTKNQLFKNCEDFMTCEREYLYSFMGAYNPKWYLTDIRQKIYDMSHTEDSFIKSTDQWHFEKTVYSAKQNRNGELNIDDNHRENTVKYNEVLLNSRYSLCPSGSGPNSIRFWESLGCGSIPVLLADTLELPQHELWSDAILRVSEKDVETIPTLLREISNEREQELRRNCITIYNHFKDNYRNKHD